MFLLVKTYKTIETYTLFPFVRIFFLVSDDKSLTYYGGCTQEKNVRRLPESSLIINQPLFAS